MYNNNIIIKLKLKNNFLIKMFYFYIYHLACSNKIV